MTLEIRQLNQGDAGELFRLRRSALLDSPWAFLASPEDDMASSEEAVRELLKPRPESVVFGAYAPPRLIGMLGLHRATQRKAAHKASLWGMFVLPEFRGQGVAARLLDKAIRHARTMEGVASVHLCVSESAIAARRLYEKAGFETWGVEPDAIRFEGKSEGDRHMWLPHK